MENFNDWGGSFGTYLAKVVIRLQKRDEQITKANVAREVFNDQQAKITELEQKLKIAMECVELYCDDDNECYGDYHPPNFARKCRDKIEQVTERRMR